MPFDPISYIGNVAPKLAPWVTGFCVMTYGPRAGRMYLNSYADDAGYNVQWREEYTVGGTDLAGYRPNGGRAVCVTPSYTFLTSSVPHLTPYGGDGDHFSVGFSRNDLDLNDAGFAEATFVFPSYLEVGRYDNSLDRENVGSSYTRADPYGIAAIESAPRTGTVYLTMPYEEIIVTFNYTENHITPGPSVSLFGCRGIIADSSNLLWVLQQIAGGWRVQGVRQDLSLGPSFPLPAGVAPFSLSYDPIHNYLIVADQGQDRNFKVWDLSAQIQLPDYGVPGGVYSGDPHSKGLTLGWPWPPRFQNPIGAGIDQSGNLYFADAMWPGDYSRGAILLKYQSNPTGGTYPTWSAVSACSSASGTFIVADSADGATAYLGNSAYSLPSGAYRGTTLDPNSGGGFHRPVLASTPSGPRLFAPGPPTFLPLGGITWHRQQPDTDGQLWILDGSLPEPIGGWYTVDWAGNVYIVWNDSQSLGLPASFSLRPWGGTDFTRYDSLPRPFNTPGSTLTGIYWDPVRQDLLLSGNNEDYPTPWFNFGSTILAHYPQWNPGTVDMAGLSPDWMAKGLPVDQGRIEVGGRNAVAVGDYVFLCIGRVEPYNWEVRVYNRITGTQVDQMLSPMDELTGYMDIYEPMNARLFDGVYHCFLEGDHQDVVVVLKWHPL